MTKSTFPSPLLSFESPKAKLETVGGKGANLAHLAHASFPVPPGFFIPTAVYREYVKANRLDEIIRAALADLDPQNPQALETASHTIRSQFAKGSIPASLTDAIDAGYAWLGMPAVAVRSSATAEDLPNLSFAGQQDTFLNVIGLDPLRQAIIACWSSLWTARAIGYRARNNVAQTDISLAVVVQKMVPSEASGVLFTANPLTGNRTQTVIDATLGLGEALVSGQVEPDHYVIDSIRQTIVSKSLGSKALIIKGKPEGGTVAEKGDASIRTALQDATILALAKLGQQVAATYHAPQDIEWAWADGELYLLQSRPITSLYPVPDGMQAEPLRVMLAFSDVQGIITPITPLGQDIMKTVAGGAAKSFGYSLTAETQQIFMIAGERIFIDFTSPLSNSVGQKIAPFLLAKIDPMIEGTLNTLLLDPRLQPKRNGIRLSTLGHLLKFILPTMRRVASLWINPQKGREKEFHVMDTVVTSTEAHYAPKDDVWTDLEQQVALIAESRNMFPDVAIPFGVTGVIAGIAPLYALIQNLATQVTQQTGRTDMDNLVMEISRGLPYNVTTEMDLSLWHTAMTLRNDPESKAIFSTLSAEQLAEQFQVDQLPEVSQTAISEFLRQYGMRGLGEIDLGNPRWREQPIHVMQLLQSYIKIDNPDQAPDAVFARGEQAAKLAADRLEVAVRALPGGWFKAKQLRWAISRHRALGGLREAPKFFAIRMMGILRQGLLRCGQAFTSTRLLEKPDDLFFLHIDELKEIAAQKQVTLEHRERIAARRAAQAREAQRRQIPHLLLSDGTAYYGGMPANGAAANVIVGSPVSPGTVEGTVHVVLDPNSTQLAPGEILVCPATDPAWTPLFLSAGGLIMEVGGMMTHGSVVAREYGIPAVVGIEQATTRLKTGQRVRVDGSTGNVMLLD
jgi:pyruvate,water dikinase